MTLKFKALGIDVGGTHTRYVLFDGDVIERGELNWKLGEALKLLRDEIEELKGRSKCAVVGLAMKGVWNGEERRKAKEALGVDVVMSDVEGAFYDAFEDEGIVVVAGTGSICYGRKGNKVSRFGGFGPLVSGWGSAFWIGRLAAEVALKKRSFLRIALFGTEDLSAIRDTLADIHTKSLNEAVRTVAGYAKRVVEAAEIGDEDALFVVNRALSELLGMCLWVREELGDVRDIALHGGLFSSEFFRNRFKEILRRYSFGKVIEETDAARGVAKYTLLHSRI